MDGRGPLPLTEIEDHYIGSLGQNLICNKVLVGVVESAVDPIVKFLVVNSILIIVQFLSVFCLFFEGSPIV